MSKMMDKLNPNSRIKSRPQKPAQEVVPEVEVKDENKNRTWQDRIRAMFARRKAKKQRRW